MQLQRRCLVSAAVLLAIICSAPVWAQSQAGTITGVVRDSTGVSVPGVTVTATNQATSASQSATTGTDGTFSVSVAPGSYNVTVAMFGFRRITQTVDVTAGAARPLEFSLQPQLSEEVTVTALKRESALLEVPFSIAAPTEEVLRSRGVENMEGVAANVGGFTVQNLGPGQSQVAMRGVSAGQIVRDQPGVKEQVGTYLDESVVSLSLFTPDLDLFDVNRVEVLRGPQGTLFGSGSLSGTVRYMTNQPRLGVTEGAIELGANAVNGGNGGGDAKLAVNVPLGRRNALRTALYYTRLPGYIDAVQPDLSVKKNVNDGFRSGFRAAVRLAPTDHFSITPRLVYQRVDMNGWNRVDVYNILANPYTTTRPKVTLGPRSQFTQLQEKFTDDFVLGDLNLDYNFGSILLTSVSSFNYRDVLVVRDAGALTSSITGGTIGLPQSAYTLNAPLNDATTAKTGTEELRFSRAKGKFPWVAGTFFSHQIRDYGQDLPVKGFEDLTGISTRGLRAPKDSLFFSDLGYKLTQIALFGEGTYAFNDLFSLTAGLRYNHFSEDKAQIFDGIFGNDNNGVSLSSQPGSTNANDVAPRVIATFKLSDTSNLNAQLSRGFRLGGINDPLNDPLCTPQDLITFGGRESWKDETAWNYEVGYKTRLLNHRASINVSGFYMDIHDLQATVTAGSCSSRLIFNVPKARSRGFEAEFDATPNSNFDFAVSLSANDSELRSTLTSTDASGAISVVAGIEEGQRLPTVPRFQLASAATYQHDMRRGSQAYVTGTYQYIGSRFTQVGDQNLGTLNLLSFEPSIACPDCRTIGGPLTATTFTYDPKLPAYDILNLRGGVRHGKWDISVYLNNVTDERALLAFDQERGTRARISFLTNQPRTFGTSIRTTF